MNLVSSDFGSWLNEARLGSRDALGNALEECRRYLLSIARQELAIDLQAKGGASDLVQDTFLDAQRAFEQFHGSSEIEMRAWLRGLLHHRASKFGRRYRGTQKRKLCRESSIPGDYQPPSSENRPTPSVVLMAHEQAEQLQKALERLPEDYRLVITLRYLEKCSFEEVGLRLNRTPNAARLLWLRAIDRIKHELKEIDEDK
jgi:RNA polymerase sigma-70 factor (ECF subfamily)